MKYSSIHSHGLNSHGGGGGGIEQTGDGSANTLTGGGGGDRLSGLGGDDLITAGAGADRLDGGEGNDTIDAGSGSDEVLGGRGDDWITSDNAASVTRNDVKIDDRSGDNHVDVLGGSLTRADIRTGAGADVINVTGGARVEVDSGRGADAISASGHFGDLRLTLGSGAQTVDFAGGASFDKLRVDHFQSGDSGDVLNLSDYLHGRLSGWDSEANPNAEGFVQLVGNGFATLLQIDANGGGDDFSTLLALGGDAAAFTAHNFAGLSLTVGAGDVYVGDDDGDDNHGGTTGDDNLNGSGGDDTLRGGKGSDDLTGGTGDDHLDGGQGNDTLESGGGSDDLHGGRGADDFVFTVADGSTVVIQDFEARKDVIDLSAIDANPAAEGDQAFAFVTAFSHAAGEATLAYDDATKVTTAQFDADGDGVSDLTLQIAGHVTDASGWVL